MKAKKGDMQISFGMIFSIILIIAFIVVAFYVIRMFLGFKNCGQVGSFYQEVQDSVKNAWQSPATSQTISSTLPGSVQYVCIIDVNSQAKGAQSALYDRVSVINKNFVPYPTVKCSGLVGIDLTYINLPSITSSENPYCIKTTNGKINLRIEKDLYEKLVRISR